MEGGSMMQNKRFRLNPGSDSTFAVPMQSMGLLSTLIFLANCTFEVFVVNDLYGEQHGLIALLLVILCVWAMAEVAVLQRRKLALPLASLQLVLGLQLGVVLVRHGVNLLSSPPVVNAFGTASRPQFGMAISFAPAYLLLFLAISKLIIDVFIHAEQRRANLLQAQRDALELARQDLRDARDAAEAANLALLAANARLHGQATTDPLTGLSNRRHFEAALADQVDLTRRFQEPLSLLLVDIDHFKTINDRFGNQCGDLVLVELARLLKASLRKPDLLARWGGDEFIVMLPHTSAEEALELARQLCGAMAVHVFPAVQVVTGSIGVAAWQAGETLEQWFARVDKVLYVAKAAGRNAAKLSAS